jgi:hypothetical protein
MVNEHCSKKKYVHNSNERVRERERKREREREETGDDS